VTGTEPEAVHEQLARVLDASVQRIAEIQNVARGSAGVVRRPRWPAIVMRTPKGWTGPREVDRKLVEDTFRSHQVPVSDVRNNPEHLRILEAWLRSYRPDELFDLEGRLLPHLTALAPKGARRMSANPASNPGNERQPLRVPPLDGYALPVTSRGSELRESTRQLGLLLRDIYRDNPESFRLFCPDETNSNRLGAVFETEERCLVAPPRVEDERVSPRGRVMEVLSEHNCQGWLEGYTLTGRHGLFATYEAFALIVASMATQHAKWLEACADLFWRKSVPSLNYLLTSTCWRNDHNGFSHQGPGFMDTVLSKKGNVSRLYLPPDANCLLAVADHCLRSTDHVNLIIIDKQPQLQWLDLDAARAHCAAGASVWDWAGTPGATEPDIVLACAGDTATQETLAAAAWLAERAPQLTIRVVNVVDLMTLATPDTHPHGMTVERFDELFGATSQVVFAFHGYPGLVHQLLHGRPAPGRFHVRGYREEGTTTTPFDMVVLNQTSRFHLAELALRHARSRPEQAEHLIRECHAALARHTEYVRACFEDLPEIRDFRWPERRP